MEKFMNLINGNKTYSFALVAAIVVFLDVAQILPTNDTLAILGLISAGAVASIRHAIQKLEK